LKISSHTGGSALLVVTLCSIRDVLMLSGSVSAV